MAQMRRNSAHIGAKRIPRQHKESPKPMKLQNMHLTNLVPASVVLGSLDASTPGGPNTLTPWCQRRGSQDSSRRLQNNTDLGCLDGSDDKAIERFEIIHNLYPSRIRNLKRYITPSYAQILPFSAVEPPGLSVLVVLAFSFHFCFRTHNPGLRLGLLYLSCRGSY
jgi:hypothetical protein